MKKLINGAENVITDTLRGVAAADPRVEVDADLKVIYRKAMRSSKVDLASGGGSGHRPLHGGYVGHGMLDVAAASEVFTSPTSEQVLLATQKAGQGAGVLHVVRNCTDDVMSFDMAAEVADAEGIKVRSIVVADDMAVQDSLYTAGRRRVGLTMLVEKIVGATAEAGCDLDGYLAVVQKVCDRDRSMGIALTSHTVPAMGHPTFDLPTDEIEVGIGIHNEPGRERVKLEDAKSIARRLVEPILEDYDFSGDPAIVLMNGVGGTPSSELYLMYAGVRVLLDTKGIEVARVLVGNYITSLDMTGCSVTLPSVDTGLLGLSDAPMDTAGLCWRM